jgi:hypothetical protein
MARGLSDLQKYILKTSAEMPGDGRYRSPGWLYNFEICEGFYGWKAGQIIVNDRFALNGFIPPECDHAWTSTGGKYPNWKCSKCGLMIQPANRQYMVATKNFEPLVVGEKKYNAVQVAIHKAVERLEKRGLAERIGGYSWRGVLITEKGREVVAGWDKPQTA